MKFNKNLIAEFIISDSKESKKKPPIKEDASIEDMLAYLINEVESLKTSHNKLLTENHIIPKEVNGHEVYLKVGGVLFKGSLKQIE